MAQGTTKGVPIDIDPLLANNSDLLVPSQKAVKTYVDTTTSSIVSTKVSKSGDTMSGSLILSGDPTIPFGAATKSYVDTLINGIDWKAAANAGTTTSLPTYTVSGSGQILTGTVTIPVIDGVTLTVNQRLLVKNETSTRTPNNGIYIVTQVNPFILTRSSDANTPALLSEATISVAAGDTLSNTQWHCNPASIPIVIGTTYITFAKIGSGTYSFSPPLVDTGSVISIPSSNSTVNGYLSSADWTNFNTAYTSRIATFTVTGNSGAATFSGNILNIPEYTISGLNGAGLALANTFTNINTITKNDSVNAIFNVNNSLSGGGIIVSSGAGTAAEIRYGAALGSIGVKLYGLSSGSGTPLSVYDGSSLVSQISSAGTIIGTKIKIYGGSTTGFLKANGDVDSNSYITGTGSVSGTNTGDQNLKQVLDKGNTAVYSGITATSNTTMSVTNQQTNSILDNWGIGIQGTGGDVGVFGTAIGDFGTIGVKGISTSDNGVGVYGFNSNDVGVKGVGYIGGSFYGYDTGLSVVSDGVNAMVVGITNPNNVGIKFADVGEASGYLIEGFGTSGVTAAGYLRISQGRIETSRIEVSSLTGYGIYCNSHNSVAFQAEISDSATGLFVDATGINGYGVLYQQGDASTGSALQVTKYNIGSDEYDLMADIGGNGTIQAKKFIKMLGLPTEYLMANGDVTTLPVTTKGDIYTYSSVPTRLPVGTAGQVLSVDLTTSIGLKWTTPSSGSGTVTSVGGTGTIAGLSLSGTVTTTGNLTLSGTLSTPVSTINDSTLVGRNLVKLAIPSAITFIQINADNSVSTLSASSFRTAIGAGTGTVTSVTGTAPVSVATGTTTPVISMAPASTSVDGYLASSDWTNFNNAYTNRITSLTVTGSSGAASLSSNTLNIPTYTLAGLLGAPLASPVFTGTVQLPTGSTTAGSLYVPTNSALLTTQTAGSCEFDSTSLWLTRTATLGRGYVPSIRSFMLTSAGTGITVTATGTNYFGSTSNIPLVASNTYEIEINLIFTATTLGTRNISIINLAAPTAMNVEYEQSPITGIVAPPGTATTLKGNAYNQTSATYTITTGILTTAVVHRINIKLLLINGTGTSLKINAWNTAAGTITPGIGSYWKATTLPSTNLSTYAT